MISVASCAASGVSRSVATRNRTTLISTRAAPDVFRAHSVRLRCLARAYDNLRHAGAIHRNGDQEFRACAVGAISRLWITAVPMNDGFHTCKPKPPSGLVEACGWKRWPRSSGGMPVPESRTAITKFGPSHQASTSTVPPSGMARAELSSKLISTRSHAQFRRSLISSSIFNWKAIFGAQYADQTSILQERNRVVQNGGQGSAGAFHALQA